MHTHLLRRLNGVAVVRLRGGMSRGSGLEDSGYQEYSFFTV